MELVRFTFFIPGIIADVVIFNHQMAYFFGRSLSSLKINDMK